MKVKLGDLTKIRTGKLDANAASENGKYPFFTCSKEPLRISTYSYDCECVLVAGNGDLNTKYYNGKFDAYQRTYIIESNSDRRLYLPYLYYFMTRYIQDLRRLSIGGVIKYIKLGNLTDVEISLPDIEEQKVACKKLEKVKNIIDKKESQLFYLDNLIKARFVEMFGCGYEEVELSELGKISTGSTPTMKNKDFYENADIPFYKPGDFIDGVSNIDCSESFVDTRAESASRIMDSGTVAVTCIGIIGKVGIIKRRGICNQQINFIVPNDNVNSIYLAYAIDTKKKFMQEKANAPVVPILNKTNFSKVTIPLSPIGLQNQFATFVAQVDKSKFALQNNIISLMNLWYNINQYVCERTYGEA